MATPSPAPPPEAKLLDQLPAPVNQVRTDEGAGALLLAFSACLLLFTCQIMKTVREPLILD